MTIKKVGILTGGGDCPGLNSVIYGILLKASELDIECLGILKGWEGLIENLTMNLKIEEHNDLHTIGGTILYTSPFLLLNYFFLSAKKNLFTFKLIKY